ncbi:PAS domain-containing protein [Brevundimonas sp.]|uniref:PAS domain-containing protein n=1 Tax=Brevundimonas sp. TaxID=1871086 RepID=UPI0035B1BCD6
MARRIGAFDWATTPLGPIATWPQSLRTAVGLMVAAPNPIVLLWGLEGVLIYNDGYARFAGERHPQLLGMGTREGWPEIAEHNDRMIRRVLGGEPVSLKDQQLVLDRRGQGPEPAWMDLDYTPVPDETGRPAGVMVFVTETTERFLADERSRMREERLDMALDIGGGVGVWDWDVPNDRVYADKRFARLYGVDPRMASDGAAIEQFFAAMHAGDAERVQGEISHALSTGEPFRSEYRLVQADGEVRWVAALGRPERDADGRTIRFPGVTFDITERRRTDETLAERELRYRTLFETIDEGFCVIEFLDGPEGPLSDYVHVEANAAYEANAGISNVVGQKVREMVPDEAGSWVELYRGVLTSGQPIRFEKELEATGRWLELAAFRVGDPERRQVAVLFKDLTDRKQAERSLQALNATLEHRVAEAVAEKKLWADIIESADAFVQVVDREGRWLAINNASATEFERIFGVRPEAGQKMSDAIAHLPGEAAAVKAIWDRALAEAPFTEVQEFGDPSRDRRFYEMRYYPLMSADGDRLGAYQIVNDVTDRLAEQARLREAEEALRQSQKMEAIGQLTGGIAHDFNNLLAGIIGSLELLSKRLSENRLSGIERYIEAASGSAQRAASLTQRLLAFSRRQTLDPRPTDLNRLIGGMEDLIRRSVGPAVEVEVVGAGGLWTTRVDPSQLENALLNLCINARDAMAPQGGRLTIETANKWLDDRHARERDLPPGQYVSLCVTDTGTGMTPEIIDKAFDPFFTTKPMGQGTGLGLSMVHGFVRQSGGQVRIYSEAGDGTTMCLYLPRHLGAADEIDPEALTAAEPNGHGETVLVIDDEPTVRMLIVEVLGEAGYHVLQAEDGASGLEVLRSEMAIDLLVTDVGLPGGLNGRQVADAARALRPDLKVLFVTGYAENAVIGNGHLEPGMAVITKPFVVADLAAKVTEMIEG